METNQILYKEWGGEIKLAKGIKKKIMETNQILYKEWGGEIKLAKGIKRRR